MCVGQVGDRLAGSVGRASRRVSARLAASKEWRVAAMAGRVQARSPTSASCAPNSTAYYSRVVYAEEKSRLRAPRPQSPLPLPAHVPPPYAPRLTPV